MKKTTNHYQIFLKWTSPDGNDQKCEMDYAFKNPSIETFEEIAKRCENLIEEAIQRFGYKEWIFHYSPYEYIILKLNGSTIKRWSLEKYLRERRSI